MKWWIFLILLGIFLCFLFVTSVIAQQESLKKPLFQLTLLELIFLGSTILAVFGNVIQAIISWRDKKNFQRPLSNSLLALFNDIKVKSINVYSTKQLLWHKKNPHSDTETLRWEYNNSLQAIHCYLLGFQEAVVGLLVSLNPKDKIGQEAFRASEYGLTDKEKAFRELQLKRLQSQEQETSLPEDTLKEESKPSREEAK